VRQVARDLGVRYVLEGSVRRSGDRLRITAQLLDGATGAPLWAEHFDGALSDVFDFQDRITENVAMLVEPRIQAAELARSRRERPGSVAAYDIYLRTLALILSETESGNAEAYALLGEGLALEPDNALLLAHAAWVLEHRHTVGWPPLTADDVARCGELARRALEHTGGDALLMAHCGIALLQTVKDYDWGMAVLKSAAEANPNNPMVLVRAAVGHLHCGDLDACLALAERANRLGPGDGGAHFALCLMADVHLIRGDYVAAVDCAARSRAINPNFDPTLWVLIAANAHLGRMDEARRFVGELRRLAPGVTIASIRAGQPAKDPARTAARMEGLRLAGLPET
jgi:hypothetical protein